MTSLTASELAVLLGALVLLSIGTLVRLLLLRSRSDDHARSRRDSLKSWWVLTVLFVAAVLAGPVAVCLLIGAGAWLGLVEYGRLVATRPSDRAARGLVLAAVPVVQLLLLAGGGQRTLLLVPLALSFLVLAIQLVAGDPVGWVRSTAGLVLGALLLVGGLSHASLLFLEPPTRLPEQGRAGWFVLLILLTELDDISQAIVGRRFGKRRLAPRISPGKTVEGLLGGLAVTLLAAAFLAPLLTPLGRREHPGVPLPEPVAALLWPVLAGLVVVVAGLLGDLSMSAVKRDAGVKDSGTRLPGIGGVLDRVDSLTLSAPCLYWLVAGGTG